jgi:hypothetical protein
VTPPPTRFGHRDFSVNVVLGARTSRPHSERSSLTPLTNISVAWNKRRFALRTQCGRDVALPAKCVGRESLD